MATNNFDPTPEQVHAIDLARTGGSLALEALAGAGKTSTLTLVAEALAPARGAYVAFNRKIVDEAKERFPKTVACSTAHGLGMRAVGVKFRHRLNDRRMSARDMAAFLGLDLDTPTVFDGAADETVELSAESLASIANQTVALFCRTADHEITGRLVPFQRGLDKPGERGNNHQLQEIVLPLARRIWADLTSTSGRWRFEHNHYLKMWQLQSPRIHADFILFDEAQDANPLMMDIVEAQDHAQRIWVGDSNQAIYEWNGAVDAIARADVEHRARLTESFRFGPEIAEQANIVLERLNVDARVTGSGRPGTVCQIDKPDVWLGRTNAEVVARALDELAQGRRVCVQGGTAEIIRFAEAAERLTLGLPANHPELSCFKTWEAVGDYADTDDGADLKTMVRLINSFGPRRIIDDLGRAATDPRFADVTVSTAHKAKGAEWGSVALLGDFATENPPESDLRLLYVAVTRAKVELDRTMVDLEGRADPDSLDSVAAVA